MLPHAKGDIRKAALWYNKKSKGLGKKFTSKVRETVSVLKQNPKSSNIRYDNIRTAVLDIFPFMIHYSIDESNKTIIISSVLHTSRNPKLWEYI